MAKNLVIIGGSSGVGLEIIKKAVNLNYTVYNFSRNEPLGINTNSLIHHQHDVLSDTIDTSILPDMIDAFIYCPGSINLKPINRLTKDDFRTDYEINVVSAFDTFQKCLPNIKKSDAPKALFFSTVAVAQGMTFHASIAASKAAVEGMVRSCAAELAPKVNVNCIALSLTDTPLASKLLDTDAKKEVASQRHPLKKYGNPSEIASLAMFLISYDSSWITGQVIHADGGMSIIR
jgi:NAD(P)-dependent dehydrogenase (short-subunit alcohol dehydrogenase family)